MNLISVIVTTYNSPEMFNLCLGSLFSQNDNAFEIIIADDGSTQANLELTKACCAKSPIPNQYVYHEDLGFRAGAIRNKAVALSKGDYLIFIDGDCILSPDFIAKHRQLAMPGHFVPGGRVLLSETFTQEVIGGQVLLHQKPLSYFVLLRLQKKINRLFPFFRFPLGYLRLLQSKNWQKAITCNLAVFKNDFIKVNGFDELFEGWGHEDSDLVMRLIHAGIKRKEGRFIVPPVLHLWHPQNDRTKRDLNYQRLQERLNQPDFILAIKGISQYLE
ncbi:MAG: glycosyltransferase family 2 protein [Methylococcaceae bacterium]